MVEERFGVHLAMGQRGLCPHDFIVQHADYFCAAEGNEDNDMDLIYINVIIARVVALLANSI